MVNFSPEAMFKIGRKKLQENFPHSKLKQYTLLKFIFEDESDYLEFLQVV